MAHLIRSTPQAYLTAMPSPRQLSGKSLSDARALLKLTQKEVAGLAGISVSTVRRLERGEGASAYAVGKLHEVFEREGVVFIKGKREANPSG